MMLIDIFALLFALSIVLCVMSLLAFCTVNCIKWTIEGVIDLIYMFKKMERVNER